MRGGECELSTVSPCIFFPVVPRMFFFFQDFFCTVYPLNIHARVVCKALSYSVVCWSWLAAALKNQLGACLHNSMFSDDKLVVWNWPQWEYLHYRHKQRLHIRASFAGELIVKHLIAHHCFYSGSWHSPWIVHSYSFKHYLYIDDYHIFHLQLRSVFRPRFSNTFWLCLAVPQAYHISL